MSDDHDAFLARWDARFKQGKHGGAIPVARCVACGFECFAGADATIEEHDRQCATTKKAPPHE